MCPSAVKRGVTRERQAADLLGRFEKINTAKNFLDGVSGPCQSGTLSNNPVTMPSINAIFASSNP